MPLAVAAALPTVAQAESLEERVARLEAQLAEKEASKSSTEYSFGGYIKLDAIYSSYSSGERATATVGDDFLVASTIPVGGSSGDTHLDMQAKHSRLWFKTKTQTDAGEISSHIEMDFGVNQIGDERISNSSVSRVRHAFVKWQYDKNSSLLAGQSWTTFFNVASLPETLDFVGPVGTIFERQAQIRWTQGVGNGAVMFALENPSSGLLSGGAAVGGSAYDNNSMPDVVLRYDGKAGDLAYSVAAVGREIAYKEASTTFTGDDSTMAYGVSFSGKWMLGKDDIKFQLNAGTLGRYMGLQTYRDGVIEANGDIELIDAVGGFIAYRHFWSDKLRSSFVYSATSADNPQSVQGGSTPESYNSIHTNLLYSPTAKLTLGAEYIFAEKTIEGQGANGEDSGDMDRVQFSVKYDF
ncbi:hypothetical protein IB286_07915 [Spongiibacter sp. KMU-158]|uniref:Porin n=1 Tax=Spongiibacter pelagi TaxID=2760804 RepID=A0A927C2F8_9GAMM|nr:hypothetical protein [Spongiibacter pelagi]